MAVTVTRHTLSSSAGGQPIQVAGTSAGTATPIHTAAGEDEIYIEAVNSHLTSAFVLKLEWGAAGTSNEIPVEIQPNVGLTIVINGLTLDSGKVVQAYSDTGSYASEINIVGQVNRIVES